MSMKKVTIKAPLNFSEIENAHFKVSEKLEGVVNVMATIVFIIGTSFYLCVRTENLAKNRNVSFFSSCQQRFLLKRPW